MKKILAFALAVMMLVGCVFSLASCNDKELVGFDIDLAKEVGKKLNLEVEFVEINWDTKEADLQNKNIDVVWNGFTYTTDRDNGYYDEDRQAQIGGLAFSKFYMTNKQVAVAKADSSFTDNASMANAEFVAEATSAGSKVVEDIFGKSANTVEKQLDALVGVEAGTYDVAVLDASLASQYVQNKDGAYNGKLKVLDIAGVEPEYYAIGFREGSNLADVFNNVLAGLYADGVAKTIAEKYAQDGVLYNGFGEYDANYQLPTDGDYAYVKENGKIVIGYTIFSPMAYFPE